MLVDVENERKVKGSERYRYSEKFWERGGSYREISRG